MVKYNTLCKDIEERIILECPEKKENTEYCAILTTIVEDCTNLRDKKLTAHSNADKTDKLRK